MNKKLLTILCMIVFMITAFTSVFALDDTQNQQQNDVVIENIDIMEPVRSIDEALQQEHMEAYEVYKVIEKEDPQKAQLIMRVHGCPATIGMGHESYNIEIKTATRQKMDKYSMAEAITMLNEKSSFFPAPFIL